MTSASILAAGVARLLPSRATRLRRQVQQCTGCFAVPCFEEILVKTCIFWCLRRTAVFLALALPVVAAAQGSAKPFSNEQLDQMTAQVALYPDSLLAQLFMATTYPD